MPPKRKRGRPPASRTKTKSASKISKGVKEEIESPPKSGPEIDSHCCSNCFREFATKYTLRYHQKKCTEKTFHEKKRLITCKVCNKKFRFKESYMVHCLSEHSTEPDSVACHKCLARCPDVETLNKHIDRVHNRKIFECEYCKKQFVRHAHVLRHLTQKGCDGNGVSEFPCEICFAKFTRKDNLRVHLRLQHILVNYYKCKQCPYHTRNFNKLINHSRKQHMKKQSYFECDYCGKVIQSRSSMVKHLEIHGEKKFVCDVCGYSTYTVEVMRRHILTHVDKKPFKCELCENSYIQRMQLERHKINKHGDNVKSSNIQRNNSETDELSYPYENYQNAKENSFNEAASDNHLKTPTPEKLFTCAVCSKRFQSEAYMRRHVSTHALDRPRRCMYCVLPRAYVRGEQLVKHVRKQHAAVFRDHLLHVRQVLGISPNLERVKKAELESILTVLDAEAERILQGYGEGVLYGGMQELPAGETPRPEQDDSGPLMSEEELAENLGKLLSQLIDKETLQCFGWPKENVDEVLEKVIEQCGSKAADRNRWTRVQRLRENAKYLFLYVIEDQTIARMLNTHTIDEIIKHILSKVVEDEHSGE